MNVQLRPGDVDDTLTGGYIFVDVDTAALLDGVNVAALGLMAGVTWQLGVAAVTDWLTALLAVAATVLLFRFKINSAWLVLAGGVIGLAVGWVGLGGRTETETDCHGFLEFVAYGWRRSGGAQRQ